MFRLFSPTDVLYSRVYNKTAAATTFWVFPMFHQFVWVFIYSILFNLEFYWWVGSGLKGLSTWVLVTLLLSEEPGTQELDLQQRQL